jgi:transposase-like protein
MANHERDAAKERFWRDVFKRQAKSGLSVRAFCQREQLTESAFFAWRRTIGERDGEAKPRTSRGRPQRPAFMPVVVANDHRRDGAVAIELAGGRVLRLSESIATERLAELIHALETRTLELRGGR